MADADLDVAAVESYLEAELGVAVTDTEVLADGLNLNVAVETAHEGRAYVLRRPTKLRDAGYINDVDREYAVLRRLRETPVPAPEPVLHCADESVAGDPFLVVTYLDGEAVPLGSHLPERFRTPESRRRVAHGLVDALAEIHDVDGEPFEAVCERRSPRAAVALAADRLDGATSVTGHEVPALRSVGQWLRRNAPSDAETTLVHGDFRPANVLLDGTERPSVAGVLDWETALLGDPLTEVGYLLLRWDGGPAPSLDGLAARHPDADALDRLEAANESGLAPFTSEPGSPSRREVVARYEERTGRASDHERFYLAHAAFALATVWEDIDRHSVVAGGEPGRAPHVEYLGLVAERIVDGDERPL